MSTEKNKSSEYMPLPEFSIPEEKAMKKPLIEDVNGDKVLQSSELLKALNSEDADAKFRDRHDYNLAGGKVHAALEIMGTKIVAESYKNLLSLEQNYSERYSHLLGMLNQQSVDVLEKMLNDARNTSNEIAEIKKEVSADTTHPRKNVENVLQRLDNASDFMDELVSSFPKGVKIDARDVSEIMSHFAEMPVAPSTPHAKPKGRERS